MRIKRSAESEEEIINLSSLLDILFILIIFFLATSTFEEEERDARINLPNAGKGDALSSAPNVMVINVREDGSILLGKRLVKLEELRQQVKAAVDENPDQKVLIRGDENARHGAVAQALLTCKGAGVDEANIGYEVPE